MHRVKGLEFDHVIVASANDRIIPLEKAMKAGDGTVAARNAETGGAGTAARRADEGEEVNCCKRVRGR